MPTSYPASFDALTNPASADPLTSPSHASQHANANDAIEAIQVRAGLTGTAFPASPATGARFTRTDRNIDYYYDGTQWLSTTLYTGDFAYPRAVAPLSASGTLNGAFPHFVFGIYIEQIYGSFNVQTTNDATNYWTAAFQGVTLSTVSNVAGTWTLEQAAKNATVSPTDRLEVTITKVAAPGNMFFVMAFTYRLVG